MNRLFFLFMILCCFQYTIGFSQSKGKISGTVKDTDGVQLEFISVALVQHPDSILVKGTLTDSIGTFVFGQLSSGNYKVQINHIGYKSYTTDPIQLTDGLSIDVKELILVSSDTTREEVTVMGVKRPLIEHQADRTVLNVENSILSEGNTALEILEKAPGIMVDNDGNITLKGKPGVMVMINGKQTYMSQRELTALLRGTSSSSIAKVEVINNPSSKYDAAGNAGIINIVMKKNVKLGLNGNVYVNAGTSRKFRHGYGIALNYRTGWVNWFGSYDYTDREEKEFQENTRAFNYSKRSYQTSTSLEPLYTNNFKAGADYNINDKNAIGILINGSIGSYSNNSESSNLVLEGSQFISDTRSVNSMREGWGNVTYSLNYNKQFKTEGRELSADLSFSDNNFSSDQLMNTNSVDASTVATGAGFLRRGMLPSSTKIYVGKIDHVHPLGKSAKLEAGWKSSIVNVYNDVRYDTLAGNEWQNDATMTNQFNYKENINAVYANISKELAKYSIQVGLRVEHTHTEGYQVTIDSLVVRDYTQLFPSFFMKRTLTEKQSVQFSYSRRIERPDYSELNPFRFYRDPYLYYTGNPVLFPQYSNSFELSHDFNGKVITALNYSKTDGVITWVANQIDSTNTTYERPQNLRSMSNYGLSCTVNMSIAKWWTGSIFGNLNYNDYKDKDLNNSIVSYSFNLQQSFLLRKGFSMEVSGTYYSKSIYGIYTSSPYYWLSIGIQKQFLKKITAKLSVNDIFQTKLYKEHALYQNVEINAKVRPDSRNIMLSISYRLGSNAITGKNKSDHEGSQNHSMGR